MGRPQVHAEHILGSEFNLLGRGKVLSARRKWTEQKFPEQYVRIML
jgi:hypothetical protein